jgi:hypothetical protein
MYEVRNVKLPYHKLANIKKTQCNAECKILTSNAYKIENNMHGHKGVCNVKTDNGENFNAAEIHLNYLNVDNGLRFLKEFIIKQFDNMDLK